MFFGVIVTLSGADEDPPFDGEIDLGADYYEAEDKVAEVSATSKLAITETSFQLPADIYESIDPVVNELSATSRTMQ